MTRFSGVWNEGDASDAASIGRCLNVARGRGGGGARAAAPRAVGRLKTILTRAVRKYMHRLGCFVSRLGPSAPLGRDRVAAAAPPRPDARSRGRDVFGFPRRATDATRDTNSSIATLTSKPSTWRRARASSASQMRCGSSSNCMAGNAGRALSASRLPNFFARASAFFVLRALPLVFLECWCLSTAPTASLTSLPRSPDGFGSSSSSELSSSRIGARSTPRKKWIAVHLRRRDR